MNGLGNSRLRLNIAANYAGQLYTGLIGIAMVPAYFRWLGAEAFGLIGFFALITSWAQLLDLGFSVSVGRESSRFAAGAFSATAFRRILRGFEYLFWTLGVVLALFLAWQAGAIAERWLQVGRLPADEVRLSLQLMAAAVAMRWVSGLYRGVLSGVERQVMLNAFTAVIVTLRFVVAIPVSLAFGGSVVAFFAFQVIVAGLELGWLWGAVYRTARVSPDTRLDVAWAEVRPALRFSGWVGVATMVWVFVTQADKLMMSATLPLSEFGFFTAAVNAAAAVSMLSIAVTQGLLPRLVHLHGFPDQRPLLALYRRATRFSVAAGAAVTLTLMTMAEQLLFAWTGNPAFADAYGPVLALYAAGNAFMLLAAFPYGLQHAAGDLRLHVLGNVLLASVVVPLLPHLAAERGAIGVAWLWLGGNAAFFLLWTPLVHRAFAPGLHASWMLRDVLLVAAPPATLALVATAVGLPAVAQGRVGSGVLAACLFSVLGIAAVWATGEIGRGMLDRLRGPGAARADTDSQTR